MDSNASLAAALTAYREGRMEEASRAAEDIWRRSSDARSAALLALLEMEAGRLDTALIWNDRACAANPRENRYAVQGARLAALKGDHTAAFDRFSALLRAAPHAAGAWPGLAAAARASDRRAEARALCIAAYDADPRRAPALAALLELTADEPPSEPRIPCVPEAERRQLSVIACSNDDTRYAAMAATYDRALADWPHDIVRIADARSLAEGYNRAAATAAGEIFVFTHDDVEILAADFGHRLAQRLADCDILGVAGATKATAPGWPFAGWPHLHGSVVYPEGAGYRVTAYSRTVPIAQGMRVLDGVFLAMRREVALSIGWDAETCDGFHGYDVDFTLRAAKAGWKLAVASDLTVVHRSYGSFDEAWEATTRKLAAKHPELNGERSKETGSVACTVPDAAHAVALIDNWAKTRD